MSENRITMPMSGAGITRYFDERASRIQFQPGHVIAFGILVSVAVVLLRTYG